MHFFASKESQSFWLFHDKPNTAGIPSKFFCANVLGSKVYSKRSSRIFFFPSSPVFRQDDFCTSWLNAWNSTERSDPCLPCMIKLMTFCVHSVLEHQQQQLDLQEARQLSNSRPGHAVRSVREGSMDRPPQHKSHPARSLSSSQPGGPPCWVISLQPSASQVQQYIIQVVCSGSVSTSARFLKVSYVSNKTMAIRYRIIQKFITCII